MYTTINNSAQIKYKSNSDGRQHTIKTPPCEALVTTVDVSLQIMCNKAYAEVGEEFLYTFVFVNSSPFELTHVVCHDILNPALTYCENTMTYNGILLEMTQFEEDLELPDLLPSQSGVLQFKVCAEHLPDPAIILNSYNLTYDSMIAVPDLSSTIRKLDLEPPGLNVYTSETLYSAIVETNIGTSALLLEHSPDKQILRSNTKIHFTGTITNSGNTTLLDTFIKLTFPDGTSFVPDSLYLNKSPAALTKENTFSVGTLDPQDTLDYYYDLQVDEVLPEGDLTATAIAEGTKADPRFPYSVVTSKKITNVFTAAAPSFQPAVLTLTANCKTVEYGDTFTYSLSIYNPNDYTITDLYLLDSLTSELSYIPNSMLINNANPRFASFPDSLPLSDLDAKESHQITFDVMLNKLPTALSISNYYTLDYESSTSSHTISRTDHSNTLILPASNNQLELSHTPDCMCFPDNETICYTGTLCNRSACDCANTYISFHFPEGAYVILDSVRVNNRPAFFSPKRELYIGNLECGQSVTYQYALHLSEVLGGALLDSAVAYGNTNDARSSHPALLSNTIVNTFSPFDRTGYPPNCFPPNCGASSDNLLLLLFLLIYLKPSS